MHQIPFNQPAWPNAAANEIVQIIPYEVVGVTHYRIMVGNVQHVDGLLAGDPRLMLAQAVCAILPSEIQQVATQRQNYGQPLAYQFQPPPPPSADQSED